MYVDFRLPARSLAEEAVNRSRFNQRGKAFLAFPPLPMLVRQRQLAMEQAISPSIAD
jgi:hypothetical protein